MAEKKYSLKIDSHFRRHVVEEGYGEVAEISSRNKGVDEIDRLAVKMMLGLNHHDRMVEALSRISLIEADSSSSTAQKARVMAQIARTALAAVRED